MVGPGTDERELAARAASDPDAFAELYRRYVSRIHTFAYRRSGSAHVAEDVTSATFERALKGIARFRWQGGGFAPWLFRIASNELVEHHRRAGRARSPRVQSALRLLGPDGPSDDVATLATAGEPDDRMAAVRGALGSIRPRYQQAIALRYLSGLSHEEAAAAMGCSSRTMAVTVHRAVGALRGALGDGEGRLP